MPSTDEKEKAPSSAETLSEANVMKSEALDMCIESDVCFGNAVISASCVNAVDSGGARADAVASAEESIDDGEELMTGALILC